MNEIKGNRTKKRKGASIKNQSIGLVQYKIHSPNVLDFKSIQIDIGGWIKPDPDTEQIELDYTLSHTKKRIKMMVRNRSDRNGYIQPETIIDISTSDMISGKKRQCQYIRMDVCFFIKPGEKWDRYFITLLSKNLVQEIITILKMNPDIFNFVENEKWNLRREKKLNEQE